MVKKWTVTDGLPHNVIHSATVCYLPDERLVLGTEAGLSFYNPTTGLFENWTTANSKLSSSRPIVSLACLPEEKILLVGYDTAGLDIYQAVTNEWAYYAPKEGLSSGLVYDITAVSSSNTIWFASCQGGLSRLVP